MNCQDLKKLIPDYLLGQLDENGNRHLQAHIRGCAECRRELEHLTFLWTKLGVIPEEQPSERLRGRFYAMLEAQRDRGKKRVFLGDWVQGWWPRRPALQFGLAFVLAVLGLTAGLLLRPGGSADRAAVAQLRGEMDRMRNTVAVSLLNQPSAFDRLQGVQWTSRLDRPEAATLESLLVILDSDPNVNVRLAAVEALFLFADSPRVKEGILDSLPRQDSPLVQVALVDLLVSIKEKRALRAFEELNRNKRLVPDVQVRVKESIRTLS